MKRVLIMGMSGFIGMHLARRLRNSYRVYGTYYRNPPRVDGVTPLRFPLNQSSPLSELLLLLKPDATIYCAGLTDMVECEKDPTNAVFLNSTAPQLVANTMLRMGGRFIYLSTSHVFSGKEGGYQELSLATPQTAYGMSKFELEESIGHYENTFILRLGTVFGLGTHYEKSILNRILSHIWSQKELTLTQDEYRSFLSLDSLTQIILNLIDCDLQKAGLYHCAQDEKLSYFHFAQIVANVWGLPSPFVGVNGEEFSKMKQIVALPRELDLSLNASKWSESFSLRLPNIEPELKRIKEALYTGNQ